MKTKLRSKAMVSILLSGLLFTMPVGAFLMNSENVTSVFASDGEEVKLLKKSLILQLAIKR